MRRSKDGCGKANCPLIQQQWAVLERLYAQGKLRAIGVSNYCINCLQCLAQTMQVGPSPNPSPNPPVPRTNDESCNFSHLISHTDKGLAVPIELSVDRNTRFCGSPGLVPDPSPLNALFCFGVWAQVAPMVNQVQYHVGMGGDPGGLFSYARAHGVLMQSYSPLGNNASALLQSPVLREVGRSHGKSTAQVTTRPLG